MNNQIKRKIKDKELTMLIDCYLKNYNYLQCSHTK